MNGDQRIIYIYIYTNIFIIQIYYIYIYIISLNQCLFRCLGYGTISKRSSIQSLHSEQSDSDLDNLFPAERLPLNSVGASPPSSRGESPDVKPSGEFLKRSPSVEQHSIDDDGGI